MNIEDFIWLEEIEDKIIWKHNLQLYEVEEVFFNGPQFQFVERGYRRGEDVYAVQGQTEVGRFVIVYFIYKKRTKQALILSAREMTNNERRHYEKHKDN
ncbi:MAG: BrnT family toxin [Anaerolineales bacterium]